MSDPTVNQARRVATLADGRTAYEVTTWVTSRGDLPTANLFVVSIADPLNPKADVLARVAEPMDLRRLTGRLHVRVEAADLVYISSDPFARVANLNDLTVLVQDRTEAVRRGAPLYLASVVTVVYDDATTADAAYRQLLARLSALVTSWRTYVAGFETSPATQYTLPAVGISVEGERRAAWAAALAARRRAEEALATAQAAYDACDTGCALNRAMHALHVQDVAFLERAEAVASAITETDSHLVRDFVLRQGAYAANTESYAVMLAAKRVVRDAYADLVRGCDETCATRRAERDEAQAEVSRALADEHRALAAVRAVCPTFVPTE